MFNDPFRLTSLFVKKIDRNIGMGIKSVYQIFYRSVIGNVVKLKLLKTKTNKQSKLNKTLVIKHDKNIYTVYLVLLR